MTKSLSDALSSFLGQRCTQAKITLGGSLRIVFDIHDVEPDNIAPFFEPWANCWRIVGNGTVLVGEYDHLDFEHGLEEVLAQIRGKMLTAIELPGDLADARFFFGENLFIQYFQQSHEDDAWHCRLPDGEFVCVGPDNSWRFLKPDDADSKSWNTEEERLWDHSKAFYHRWKNRTPGSSQSGICEHCAYWRKLHGGGYFWDLGVCSNADSPNDGQLVDDKSGCVQWTDTLPADLS